MTEDEAKKRICCGPMHGIGQETRSKCVGSHCMAWRWQGLYRDFSKILDKSEWAINAIDDENYEIGDIPHGYCGLAGKP
jgi:hypothetical protein